MDKKTTPSRGRIMQVVEVEEENAEKQKIDVPLPSEIVKNESSPSVQPEAVAREKSEDMGEKPETTSPLPAGRQEVVSHEDRLPESAGDLSKKQITADGDQEGQKEIQPLKAEEKRDIVSELFETKKDMAQYPDISLDKKSSPFGFIVWVVALLAIVGIIGGGLLFFKQRSDSQDSLPSAVTTQTPTPIILETETPIPSTESGAKKTSTLTPTKTASPTATPKKVGLSIQVLNGSGTSGVASKMKKYLEDKGYTVVGTGNAANFDYEKTEIIIKADKISSLDKLKTDLSESYTVGSTSATLTATAAYDAQVIIGKE